MCYFRLLHQAGTTSRCWDPPVAVCGDMRCVRSQQQLVQGISWSGRGVPLRSGCSRGLVRTPGERVAKLCEVLQKNGPGHVVTNNCAGERNCMIRSFIVLSINRTGRWRGAGNDQRPRSNPRVAMSKCMCSIYFPILSVPYAVFVLKYYSFCSSFPEFSMLLLLWWCVSFAPGGSQRTLFILAVRNIFPRQMAIVCIKVFHSAVCIKCNLVGCTLSFCYSGLDHPLYFCFGGVTHFSHRWLSVTFR